MMITSAATYICYIVIKDANGRTVIVTELVIKGEKKVII